MTLIKRDYYRKIYEVSCVLIIYAPMIYTALCIMFWMRAYPLLGEVGGGWALEFSSLLGPKWHLPIGSMPFSLAQKTREFQGPGCINN
jgi:hypothetical protein